VGNKAEQNLISTKTIFCLIAKTICSHGEVRVRVRVRSRVRSSSGFVSTRFRSFVKRLFSYFVLLGFRFEGLNRTVIKRSAFGNSENDHQLVHLYTMANNRFELQPMIKCRTEKRHDTSIVNTPRKLFLCTKPQKVGPADVALHLQYAHRLVLLDHSDNGN